jgi:ribosomal protein S18 acetylase RimI-like enzyme
VTAQLANQNIVSETKGPELRQVVDFLENHALEENAWLIWSVYDRMRFPADWCKILVCRRGEDIVGAAEVLTEPQGPNPQDLMMGLDAVDSDAARAIVDSLPSGRTIRINTYSRIVQEYLDSIPGIERSQTDYFYTVSPDQFRAVDGDEVVELTPADAHLFDGLEQQPHWENADHGGRIFAIIKDGIPTASLWTGTLINERITTRRTATICAVYVESAYRERGLGKRLVSHVTGLILADSDTPLYWTSPDNIASQSLCRSLGYHQYATNVRYVWRK